MAPPKELKGYTWEGVKQELSSLDPLKMADTLGISPEQYMTFWNLSLYDIYVPKER
jgi:hypothetical protein